MNSLKQFSQGIESIPAITAWYLADLGEAKGRQELFTKQFPQRLQQLRGNAIIESTVSSNRIEGIQINNSRLKNVLFEKSQLLDRNEEELRGYKKALDLIHNDHKTIRISEENIRRFHAMTRGEIWDAGLYKEKDSDIIEQYPDGKTRVRFKTVPAKDVQHCMTELIRLWEQCLYDGNIHPLILMCAFNLDFLCIHPFRDGNGRTSRLLLLLQCYELGYEVGRYISLERVIEQNKDRYYETLEQSSIDWHNGKHATWQYINYLLSILKSSYREFEERIGLIKNPRGIKTETIKNAIDNSFNTFSLTDIENKCPGVSREMIRKVLQDLKQANRLECIGKGPGAKWKKNLKEYKK